MTFFECVNDENIHDLLVAKKLTAHMQLLDPKREKGHFFNKTPFYFHSPVPCKLRQRILENEVIRFGHLPISNQMPLLIGTSEYLLFYTGSTSSSFKKVPRFLSL